MLFYAFFINVDELNKLTDESFGVYVDKNQMERNKVLDQKNAFLHLLRMTFAILIL